MFAPATVLEARDTDEGFALVEAHPDIDALILDLTMPGLDGHLAIAEFGRRRPDMPIIVLSSSEDPRDVRRALDQGALGYIPTSASQPALTAAI